MIIDHIQNRAFYRQLGSRVGEALEYLATTDFAKMPDGKYEIDGQRIYAIVQRYRPRPLAEIVWESHRKYIDVQYVVQGAERMGYAPLGEGMSIKQDYNPERDIVFYDAQGDFFIVPERSFVVFAPQDVHAPGLAVDRPGSGGDVLKVVVKVACLP
ncbi:MAG: YhcH/YjgK/YiaL family protein [Thermoguttaceae bacterium]|jgi:YhcH/YjgK/YiaL family protein